MKSDTFLLLLVLLGNATISAHVISKRVPRLPMLNKIDKISQHLRDLTAAMTDFDKELREAMAVDRRRLRVFKRSTISQDDDGISCRLSFRADFCEALEILKEQASYLQSSASPGKRNGENPASKYKKIVEDLTKKREVLNNLNNLFSDAGNVIETEKRWFTCNLNLGFTCQTQEYNEMANEYDFVNSAASPGKKRSATKATADGTS